MTKHAPLAALAALSLIFSNAAAHAQASAAQAAGRTQPSPLSPPEIAAAAPRADWVAIPASDLLVMDLAQDGKGRARRVVIQLLPPPFSQGWIGNIRKLAGAHWWDGLSINRVQDNYVVQWGDGNAEDKAKAKPLPVGLAVMPESDYTVRVPVAVIQGTPESQWFDGIMTPGGKGEHLVKLPLAVSEGYPLQSGFRAGWPVAVGIGEEVDGTDERSGEFWPIHCYGMVGVGRDLSPNTGTGAELYVVIGQAPRHLDRNIALVGRVIEGIEHLSSLPRGTLGLGFYATPEERTPIQSIRLGTEVAGLPAYEYLSTDSASFAAYADARANRRDPFFIRPSGGTDVCNIPVPVRRAQ